MAKMHGKSLPEGELVKSIQVTVSYLLCVRRPQMKHSNILYIDKEHRNKILSFIIYIPLS